MTIAIAITITIAIAISSTITITTRGESWQTHQQVTCSIEVTISRCYA